MLVGLASTMQAQVDDVTLVVSGEGTTKDEATTRALRSAIEQAFGVFVSANTEILNDELVRDEIATVSSGNIKNYKELGVIQKTNGLTEVSLQATVSVKKLTSYAKSHGSSAEFAGAAFVQNMKLIELNRVNTEKAFQNLNRQLLAIEGCSLYWTKYTKDTIPILLYRDFYSCDVKVENIKVDGTVTIQLDYYTTEKSAMIVDLLVSTLMALAIPVSQAKDMMSQGVNLYRYSFIHADKDGYGYHKCWQESYESKIKAGEVYFYSPLLLPIITGEVYGEIIDNLNNKYSIENYWRDDYDRRKSQSRFLWGKYGHDNDNSFYSGYFSAGYAIQVTGSNNICIPYVFERSQKELKYSPKHIISLKGSFQIPFERLASVTNISAEQPKR